MTKDGSELDWQAFQYIAGELNAADTERFEARLAIDQAAREAVAAAVELSEIAAITEYQPIERVTTPSASYTHWSRSLAWLGWGAAACLLVVAFVQQTGTSPWHSGHRLSENTLAEDDPTNPSSGVGATAARAHGAPDLALVWVHTRASIAAENRLEEDRTGVVEADEDELQERRLEEAGISAPSWMVTAVAGMDADMSEGE